MAVSNQEVADWLRANPMASDAEIAQAAAAAGVSAQQLSLVTGVPVDQVISRAQTAAPEVQLNPGSWNYGEYTQALQTGGDLNEQAKRLATQDPDLANRASSLFNEIVAQQQAGSAEFWYKGNTASKEAAAADFALRLAENGVRSLNEIGQRNVEQTLFGYSGDETVVNQEIFNKTTGQPLPRPELLGRGTRGLDLDYNLAFTDNGQVIPYTSNRESGWMSFREDALKPAAAFALTAFGAPIIGATVAPGLAAATQAAIGGAIAGGGAAALTGNNVLQGALLGGAGGYLQGAGGLGAQTDASFLAADAAQLAKAGLSEAQIAQTLGAAGYASGPAANLAASMAINGLDVGTMTNQLNNLSTNTGLMSQTGSSADFLAADALQLQKQVGNNFAAIEQNLIASGVDPLIAADISQQIAFNPGLTQAELATNLSKSFGENIYDVNMATTYPTSALPGVGGLLSDVAALGGAGAASTGVLAGANAGAAAGTTAGTTTGTTAGTTAGTVAGTVAGATAGTGLTATQIANLAKAGISLAGLAGAGKVVANTVGGGGGGAMATPTQGVPTNDPNYYNQLQQYYNAYLPQTPRDVVTPLQQWYNSKSGA